MDLPDRVSQPVFPKLQNQFQNDGSFMEMFKQKMEAKQNEEDISGDYENSNSNHDVTQTFATAPSESASIAGTSILSLAATSSGAPVVRNYSSFCFSLQNAF